MNIEVTDACNIYCSSCMSPHGTNFMSVEDFAVILLKIPRNERNGLVALHWRGEPCLHPMLPDIALKCKENGVKSWISTNTAAPLLGDRKHVWKLLSNLTRIEVCVDGYNQKTLSRYRVGSDWDILLRNIDVIGSTETECRKDMRVLMFKYNDKHEAFFINLAAENGFDRVCFANPVINYKVNMNAEEAEKWLSTKREYQRYRKDGKRWILKRAKTCTPHICISVHGSVHPCGHDWKLEHNMGNLLTDDWETIQRNLIELKPKMTNQKLSICEKWCCLVDEKVVTWRNL